ncbi:MAG: septal ring lytic transglycosylase RlpA family protein [Actinobacteria bacterium]|nr:septal ring lytic transglycosylase RlpA family protein [Actinomycetota bacterium]
MESHIESHIYATSKIESYIYATSKITICLLLQFLILLFCLTLTLSLTQNKNSSFSSQIIPDEISSSKYDNLLSVDNYKNVSINNYQIYKEVDRIEGKNHNLYIEEYNYYVANNNLYSEIHNIDNVEFKEALAYKEKSNSINKGRIADNGVENSSNLRTARASWYGPRFYGKRTANGELFTKSIVSFAHKTLPFETEVKFYYNGKTVIAHCNDRGPYKNRAEFDLSYKTAKILGFSGVKTIEYEILDDSNDQNRTSFANL